LVQARQDVRVPQNTLANMATLWESGMGYARPLKS